MNFSCIRYLRQEHHWECNHSSWLEKIQIQHYDGGMLLAWFSCYWMLQVSFFFSIDLLELNQKRDQLPDSYLDFCRCTHKLWYHLHRYQLMIWDISEQVISAGFLWSNGNIFRLSWDTITGAVASIMITLLIDGYKTSIQCTPYRALTDQLSYQLWISWFDTILSFIR